MRTLKLAPSYNLKTYQKHTFVFRKELLLQTHNSIKQKPSASTKYNMYNRILGETLPRQYSFQQQPSMTKKRFSSPVLEQLSPVILVTILICHSWTSIYQRVAKNRFDCPLKALQMIQTCHYLRLTSLQSIISIYNV